MLLFKKITDTQKGIESLEISKELLIEVCGNTVTHLYTKMFLVRKFLLFLALISNQIFDAYFRFGKIK